MGFHLICWLLICYGRNLQAIASSFDVMVPDLTRQQTFNVCLMHLLWEEDGLHVLQDSIVNGNCACLSKRISIQYVVDLLIL